MNTSTDFCGFYAGVDRGPFVQRWEQHITKFTICGGIRDGAQVPLDGASDRAPDDIRSTVERQIPERGDGVAVGPAAPVSGGEARFTSTG